MENNTIGERIKKVREHYCNGDNTRFAMILDEKVATVSNWTTRGTNSVETLKKLSDTFKDLNLDWLLTGEPPMLKSESNVKSAEPFLREDLVEIPFVSRLAAATFIETNCCARDISETISVHGITKEELDKNGYVVFEVDGDSMYPTVKDNSRILAKPIAQHEWEYTTGVCFVCYGGSLVVKRIKKNNLVLDNVLTLSSDNESAGEATIRRDDIRGIWKAVSIISQKIE